MASLHKFSFLIFSCAFIFSGCINDNNIRKNVKATELVKSYHSVQDEQSTRCNGSSWIRNFHKENSGGGHRWIPGYFQKVSKRIFKCLNWQVCPAPSSFAGGDDGAFRDYCGQEGGFSCSHTDSIDDPRCTIKHVSYREADDIFELMNALELSGVPEMEVGESDYSDTRYQCVVDYNYQYKTSDIKLKDMVPRSKIFSENEFSCCKGVGESLLDGEDAGACCSGVVNRKNNSCALADYTNLNLYFNKYISSEAAGIDSSMFDEKTGYIKSSELLIQHACKINACKSNKIAYGVSLSSLGVPGLNRADGLVKKFIDGSVGIESDFYNAGMRWNSNVYCFSESYTGYEASINLKVVECQ